MIAIEISESFRSQIDSRQIEETALTALEYQSIPDSSELAIVITNDEYLHKLNHQYREVDAPTDVLSFPTDFVDPETDFPYLGDIIISYPRAVNQAINGGHDVMAELQLLVVHGILHILGHDHVEPSEKATMWAAQRDILQKLGLENLKITDDE